jgi:hypothetical protein
MPNVASTRPGARGPESQSFDAMKTAAALWILDLGVSATEARQWATADPGHPAASCLELIDAMEALAGASS